MATDRPARFAKQLASHWGHRGAVVLDGDTTTLRWDSGEVIAMTVAGQELIVSVDVPDSDPAEFAEVVARHLERFGARDELHVEWDYRPPRPETSAPPGP